MNYFFSLEALDFLKENYHTVELVVTDQTLPGRTGFDLEKDMLMIPGV